MEVEGPLQPPWRGPRQLEDQLTAGTKRARRYRATASQQQLKLDEPPLNNNNKRLKEEDLLPSSSSTRQGVWEARIAECESMHELSAVYDAVRAEKNTGEDEFHDLFVQREAVLVLRASAMGHLAANQPELAVHDFTQSLRLQFDLAVFVHLCEAMLMVPGTTSSQQVVDYIDQVAHQGSSGACDKVLFTALLRTGNVARCWSLVREDLNRRALVSELESVLSAALQQKDASEAVCRRGLELAPDCAALQDWERRCGLPCSAEFVRSGLSATEFALVLLDRLDFDLAVKFTQQEGERALLRQLAQYKSSTRGGRALQPPPAEEEEQLAGVFAARPTFHANWLVWRYEHEGDDTMLPLLERALRADPSHVRCRIALANAWVALGQVQRARELLVERGDIPAAHIDALCPPPIKVATAYQVLELDDSPTLQDIRRAYKRLALKYHPDKNANARLDFDRISLAHSLIGTPEARLRYDQVGTLI